MDILALRGLISLYQANKVKKAFFLLGETNFLLVKLPNKKNNNISRQGRIYRVGRVGSSLQPPTNENMLET